MRALPGVAPSSKSNSTYATAAAEPIPDSVIANPIIGEARRFDGTTAPSSSWMLTQGQQLRPAEYAALFSILRTVAGGDGKTTFNLPKPTLGYIIAVAGMMPTSPASLVRTGRHMFRHEDSLGPNARPVMPKVKMERPAVLAERRQLPRAVSASPARWIPLSADMETRIAETRRDARENALGGLGQSSRDVVGAMTSAVVSGSVSLADAVTRVAQSLSASESGALLDVNDRMHAAYRPGFNGAAHPNPALEAARFAMSIAFTADQVAVLRSREQ